MISILQINKKQRRVKKKQRKSILLSWQLELSRGLICQRQATTRPSHSSLIPTLQLKQKTKPSEIKQKQPSSCGLEAVKHMSSTH